MNKTTIIGRVGKKDVKEKFAVISVASSEKNTKGEYDTEWFNCIFFEKRLNLMDYIEVGDNIYIEAKRKTNEYTDKNGNKRISYDYIVNHIEFIESKKNKPVIREKRAGAEKSDIPKNDEGDDLPF